MDTHPLDALTRVILAVRDARITLDAHTHPCELRALYEAILRDVGRADVATLDHWLEVILDVGDGEPRRH